MADNKAIKSDATATILTAGTKEVAFSGDTIDIQLVELVAVGGTEGARTITEISSETDGILVNLGANNDVTATNPTAANLKAEVVGTGTFVVQSTLDAETTKIIGTVNIAAAQTIAVTGTVTANLGTIADVATQTTLSTLDGKVVACNTGAVVISSGTTAVTQATAASLNAAIVGNVASAATDSGNPVKIGGIFNTTQPTVTTGQRVNLQCNNRGGLIVANGANPFTVQPGNTANTTPWLVNDRPATSGGLSTYTFLSTAAVQAAAIKASAGQVYSMEFFNTGATPMYVRLYNMTTTPGTGDGASILWRGVIPGSTAGAGFVKNWDKGIAFGTGIGIRVTGAVGSTDATALAANVISGNVEYI